jgi:hypothetical protein
MEDSVSIGHLPAGGAKTVTIRSGSQLGSNQMDVVTLWLNGEILHERSLL